MPLKFSTRCYSLLLAVFCSLPAMVNAQATGAATIKGVKYTGRIEGSDFFLFLSRGDTALKVVDENVESFRFADFNKDGYKDILLVLSDNTPERCALYLFMPSKRRFRQVQYFSNFPLPRPVKGTGYFYSYSKSGCADNAWTSRLFYIKDYTAINIGLIRGDGCGVKDGIFISRIKKGKETLFQSLPLDTIKKYKDYKWGFIKQYWANHYRAFTL